MGYSILLAEDDAQIREIISDYFTHKSEDSICLSCAPNGTAALELLQNTEYDLILLDVMMDDMSGFSLAVQLRKHQGCAATPVVFITAKSGENDVLTGFNIGADDYVTKPFNPIVAVSIKFAQELYEGFSLISSSASSIKVSKRLSAQRSITLVSKQVVKYCSKV